MPSAFALASESSCAEVVRTLAQHAVRFEHQPTHIDLARGPLVRPRQPTEHLGGERLQARPDLVHLLRSHEPNKITPRPRSTVATHLTKYY